MTVLRRVGAALDQIALSALRAFVAASSGYAVAHASGLVGNTDQLKGLALAAVFAGLHAALHILEIATKKNAPAVESAIAVKLHASGAVAANPLVAPVVGVTD